MGAQLRRPSPDRVTTGSMRAHPSPSVRVNQRTILVSPDAVLSAPEGALGLYARVSSHDQRADLDRQVARLTEWAATTGQPVVRVEAKSAQASMVRAPNCAACLQT